MTDSVHIVCPHCQSINRVPTAKMDDHPNCGRCQHPLFTGEPIELTAATFARHAERNDIPLLVDFSAPWCGPCKMMAPVLEQLERDFSVKEYRGRVKFLSVDVEHHRKLAEDRNVMNLPTLMIFENGVAKEKVVGYRKYGDLKRYLKEKLAEC